MVRIGQNYVSSSEGGGNLNGRRGKRSLQDTISAKIVQSATLEHLVDEYIRCNQVADSVGAQPFLKYIDVRKKAIVAVFHFLSYSFNW